MLKCLHWIKPGQSGNPKGRSKGTNNLKTDLTEELSERIRIREGDRDHKVTKQRAMLKALVAKGLKGDARAIALLLNLIARLLEPDQAETAEVELIPNAQDIFAELKSRLKKAERTETED
jgi:hypothetical protein